MRLSSSFSVLLFTLVAFLGQSEAAPAKRETSFVTLPVRSLHGRNQDGLHPHVYLQQLINRGMNRVARMTGDQPPSKRDLSAKLEKRMYIVGQGGQVDPGRVPGGRTQKRSPENEGKAHLSKRRMGRHHHNGGFGAAAGAGAFGAGAFGAGTFGAGNAGAGSGTTGTNSSADANTAGVSPAVIQAALNGGLTQANTPTTSNSLGLDIDGPDTGYVAVVQMGTPPRDFKILMDSGSSDLWVASEDCESEDGGGCNNHTALGPKSSSSFVASQQQFQVTYGTGEVQGIIIKDNISVAGLNLTAHEFGVAQLESVDFSSATTDFDGLMGLAQSTLSQEKTLTPVEAMAQAGLIPKAIVSYKISRLADGKNDGEITFGALDPTKFDSTTLTTLPNVNTQGFWEANMDSVSVDGKDAGLSGRTAIIDTGTTLIIAPPNDAAAVHQLIQGAQSDGQGGFTIPCTFSQSVALTFGGKTFTIDPRDMATLPVDVTNPTGDCASGIASGAVGGPQEWLVGDVFLKNAYFSTDVTDNTVSLAKLV